MQRMSRLMVAMLVSVTLMVLAACGSQTTSQAKEEPAKLEPTGGGEFARVMLTESAAKRLDVQTVPLRQETVSRTRRIGGQIVAEPPTEPEEIPHRIEFTVTDLTKVIAGVRAVAVWVVDYSDGQIVEKEIAFYAQDDDGNVWYLGEYPEEYEDGKFVDAPTWIAGVDNARPGLKMPRDPRLELAPYFQGWGPSVEWTDYGQIDQIGKETCVPAGCYQDVLVIAESSLDEEDAFQLKYYAPGAGNVRVGWRGADASREELELVETTQLSPEELAEIDAEVLKLEEHAYLVSEEVYGQTPPLEKTLATEPPAKTIRLEPSTEMLEVSSETGIDFVPFDPANFSRPTDIDNPWLPLRSGARWVYEGFTIEGGANTDQLWARLELSKSDLDRIDPSQPAIVVLLDADEAGDTDGEASSWVAELDEGPSVDDDEDANADGVLFYLVDGTEGNLAPGEPVLVELSLVGGDAERKVVPYAAVLYGLRGETWVYTSPEPLVYIRQPITIDYIEGDRAVLLDGPPVDTQIVVVGVAELYGIETGVSK